MEKAIKRYSNDLELDEILEIQRSRQGKRLNSSNMLIDSEK